MLIMVARTFFMIGEAEEPILLGTLGLVEEGEDVFRGETVKELYLEYRRGACR